MRNRVVSEGSEAKGVTPYANGELPLDWADQLAVEPMMEGHHRPHHRKDPLRKKQNRHAENTEATNATTEALGGISPALLADLQHEVGELERDRGTSRESVVQKGLVLSEEAFEVLK